MIDVITLLSSAAVGWPSRGSTRLGVREKLSKSDEQADPPTTPFRQWF